MIPHKYQAVLRDGRGVLPYAADGAHLLFHDSFLPEVARAIDEVVRHSGARIIDFGTLTREFTVHVDSAGNAIEVAGLRLLRVRRAVATGG